MSIEADHGAAREPVAAAFERDVLSEESSARATADARIRPRTALPRTGLPRLRMRRLLAVCVLPVPLLGACTSVPPRPPKPDPMATSPIYGPASWQHRFSVGWWMLSPEACEDLSPPNHLSPGATTPSGTYHIPLVVDNLSQHAVRVLWFTPHVKSRVIVLDEGQGGDSSTMTLPPGVNLLQLVIWTDQFDRFNCSDYTGGTDPSIDMKEMP